MWNEANNLWCPHFITDANISIIKIHHTPCKCNENLTHFNMSFRCWSSWPEDGTRQQQGGHSASVSPAWPGDMPATHVTNTRRSSGRCITQVTAHADASGNRQLMAAVVASATTPTPRWWRYIKSDCRPLTSHSTQPDRPGTATKYSFADPRQLEGVV